MKIVRFKPFDDSVGQTCNIPLVLLFWNIKAVLVLICLITCTVSHKLIGTHVKIFII